MEKVSKIIKEFSKKESIEERNQTASEIKAKRLEYFNQKDEISNKENDLHNLKEDRERELNEILDKIEDLNKKINELSNSTLNKILNYFKIKKIEADINEGKNTYKNLEIEKDSKIYSKKLELDLSKNKAIPDLQETQKIINQFYDGQKNKWENSEYSKEDILKYFTEENLSSLSLDDYVLLLKRFPSEMVSHVTRQGVRDHVGHFFHTTGAGEYSNGFMKIVNDGRLRSPLGVYLVEEEKEAAIEKFLCLQNLTKEQALNDLKHMVEGKDPQGSYADRIAIHFAANEVADCYYGAEKGNEIFITYPSLYIASQYKFAGDLKAGGGYWNDQWVWANEEKGLNLNAGVIFLPAGAKVNRITGSRYELDINKNPIINNDFINVFKKFIKEDSFSNFVENFKNLIKENKGNDKKEKILNLFRGKLNNDFGISDFRLQSAILDYDLLSNLETLKKYPEEEKKFNNTDLFIEGALKEKGILFIEAKDPINSKEFWEEYFKNNPNKCPSKIVYYEEEDPTTALNNWQLENNLIKKCDNICMEFRENLTSVTSPDATAGVDRFKNLALKVIDKYYSEKES